MTRMMVRGDNSVFLFYNMFVFYKDSISIYFDFLWLRKKNLICKEFLRVSSRKNDLLI